MGRFLQTDPIGYGDGLNWYNYVGSDPVNKVDPSGMIDLGLGGDRCQMITTISGSYWEYLDGTRSPPFNVSIHTYEVCLPDANAGREGGSRIAGGGGGGRSGSGLLGTVANALKGLICNVAFGVDIGGKAVLDGKLGGGSLKLSYDATSGNIIAGLQGSRGVSGYALDLKPVSFDFGNEARHQSHVFIRVSHSEVSFLGTLRDGRIVGSGGLKAGFDFSTSDDFSAVGRFSVGKIPGC